MRDRWEREQQDAWGAASDRIAIWQEFHEHEMDVGDEVEDPREDKCGSCQHAYKSHQGGEDCSQCDCTWFDTITVIEVRVPPPPGDR